MLNNQTRQKKDFDILHRNMIENSRIALERIIYAHVCDNISDAVDGVAVILAEAISAGPYGDITATELTDGITK